jgi:hypothetical protein
LQELGNQYVPPADWLFGDRALQGFSADAVRTVTTNYKLGSDPKSGRYGQPENVVDLTMFALGQMQGTMAAPAQHGKRYITKENVGTLRQAVQARSAAQEAFAELPPGRRETMAAAARPFLENVAMSLIDLDPAFADLEGLADILAAREEQPDPTVSFARDLVSGMTSIDRVHMLDQGPFLVAKQAVETCDGPWTSNQKRTTLGRLTGIGRKIGQVCPIAGERNLAYFGAQLEAEQQKP